MKKRLQQLGIILFLSSFLYPFTIYANQMIDGKEKINQSKQIKLPVNINQATAEELAKSINGIGLNKAKKIVEYREKFGPFVTLEQLKEVSGIGQAILDKNIGNLTL